MTIIPLSLCTGVESTAWPELESRPTGDLLVMKAQRGVATCCLAVAVGLLALSGCPQARSTRVVWFINATDDNTWTQFVYDTTPGNQLKVPLPTPLNPQSAQRFEFDDAFRAQVKTMGLLNANNMGFAIANDGTFGFGGVDFIVAAQTQNENKVFWVKEPS
jgi:hypothetical protein